MDTDQILQNSQPLQSMQHLQLRDIHLPASPDFWPPAPGWWMLVTIILFAFGWAILKFIAYKRRQKQLNMIYNAFKPIEQKLLKEPDNQTLAELNILLRQLALLHFPQTEIASLSGSKWLAFLDQSGATHQFSNGAGRLLADTPYLPENRPITRKESKALIKLVKDWVKKAEIVE